MPAINFDQLFESLKANIGNLAAQTVKDEIPYAEQDGQTFLNTVKDNLETWTQQLSDGNITVFDFTYLILSQKNCGEMVALKNAGLAEARIDHFKDDLIDCIIDTISKVL